MKKLVFAFAAVVAVSFAACGNKTEQAAAPVDTDSIEEVVDSVLEDSAVVDSAAAAVVDSAAVAQ
jgi:hypothetical protein